eukprot:Skav234327  [mRNA]  locus=scaffold3161:121646:122173:+ [translate_table: standard]
MFFFAAARQSGQDDQALGLCQMLLFERGIPVDPVDELNQYAARAGLCWYHQVPSVQRSGSQPSGQGMVKPLFSMRCQKSERMPSKVTQHPLASLTRFEDSGRGSGQARSGRAPLRMNGPSESKYLDILEMKSTTRRRTWFSADGGVVKNAPGICAPRLKVFEKELCSRPCPAVPR